MKHRGPTKNNIKRSKLEHEIVSAERIDLHRTVTSEKLHEGLGTEFFSWPGMPNRTFVFKIPYMVGSVYGHRCPHGVYNGQDRLDGEPSNYCSGCKVLEAPLEKPTVHDPPVYIIGLTCPDCGIGKFGGFVYYDNWNWHCHKCGAHVLDGKTRQIQFEGEGFEEEEEE